MRRLEARLMAVAILLMLGGLYLPAAYANIPGGGTGTGSNVTLTDNSTTVDLNNGIIKATVNKANATVTSLIYRNTQLVSSSSGSANIYFSLDGGTSYQNPSNCAYSITANTSTMVDVSCKHTYVSTDPHVLDIDIHYVLRKGGTGLYVYAILSHPDTYPATSFGEWRMVWQLPHDATNYTLENVYVDALRHGAAPSYYDFTQATNPGIQEIYQIHTGPFAGTNFGKYQFSAEYGKIGVWGHASNVSNIGAWVVLPSIEFLNDGPTKQDLTIAQGYSLIHFGRNHYGASTTSLAAGESWSKIFGPYLLYCNTNTAGSEACWADAKAQVDAEKSAWPYSWLTTTAEYPAAAARGSVTGHFHVLDPLRPAQTGAGAWVGLSQPDAGGNWQFESKRYQYWVQAASDGSFTIPNIRPGNYAFSAFVNGEVDEFTSSATVAAGAVTDMGDITWRIVHAGQSFAWEIGYPDRTAAEFRHGTTDYFTGYLYTDFVNEFTNPLVYTVGVSNWATDWNYAQSALLLADGTTTTGWPWSIRFNLPTLPTTGNATLTLAFAGNDSAHIYLYVNNDAKLYKDLLYPPNGGGNALLRQGVHAKYGLQYVTIPIAKFVAGANTITLLQASSSGAGNHVMYDYLNLEMPYAPPTVSGKVTLQGRNSMAMPLTFMFTPTGSTSGGIFTQVVTPAADGAFTLANIPAGTYTVGIKGSMWLRKNLAVNTISGNAAGIAVTLLAGDINNDNQITGTDLALERKAYGSQVGSANWNASADLNGDGLVTMPDLSLLRSNYGKNGD